MTASGHRLGLGDHLASLQSPVDSRMTASGQRPADGHLASLQSTPDGIHQSISPQQQQQQQQQHQESQHRTVLSNPLDDDEDEDDDDDEDDDEEEGTTQPIGRSNEAASYQPQPATANYPAT